MLTPTYTAAEVVNLLATLDADGIELLCEQVDDETDRYTKQELFWIMNTLTGIYYHRTNRI